ncbi:MAG: zinc ribbon domain-containing protein [Kiloniellaceae bacterium]
MLVDPGTIIERRNCSGCGRGVVVKANKNGIAYYYCNGQGSDDGVGCSHHEKWGRAASLEKTRAYYAAQKQEVKNHGGDTGQQDQERARKAGAKGKPKSKPKGEPEAEPKDGGKVAAKAPGKAPAASPAEPRGRLAGLFGPAGSIFD